MNRKRMGLRIGIILALFAVLTLALAACNRGANEPAPQTGNQQGTSGTPVQPNQPAEPNTGGPVEQGNVGFGLPFDTAGEITVFLWGGDSQLHYDVGRVNMGVEDITSASVGGVVATARVFNQIYPNIAVNVYARYGDPEQDGIPWVQYREDFALLHGQPDIFAIHNLIHEIQMGTVADLTLFDDDPRFHQINPALMESVNVSGRQMALPNYVLPWGVYVNRTLADANNIDVPNHNWNISQYFRFMNNHRPNEFYGAMSPPWVFADSGTRDFHYLMATREPGDPHVRINSEPMRNMLGMMQQALPHAVWSQNADGNIDGAFMDDNWWWSSRFFQNGKLLTNPDDPWMMGDLATPGGWHEAVMDDWDIFPRPSTPYMGNHVGLVLDPIGIRNFAAANGGVHTEETLLQTRIAWEFLIFMITDTRAWDARSKQEITSGDGIGIAMNDSFPKVTGVAFYEQMELWYQAGRERFRDPAKMPGFQYVLQVWERGDIVSFSDKTVPWRYDFEGTSRYIAHEWINKWDEAVTGAGDRDPNWLDMLFSRLPDWEVEINQRFDAAWASVNDAIRRFYPEQNRP